MRTRHEQIAPYITKDGSTIRELMHPDVHGNTQISLAEATVPPGKTTALHLHKESEEIYFILQGKGVMTLGKNKFSVALGDTICIAPKTPHQITNTEQFDLKFLCSCSPAYSHTDTILL